MPSNIARGKTAINHFYRSAKSCILNRAKRFAGDAFRQADQVKGSHLLTFSFCPHQVILEQELIFPFLM